jgi:hypothetical protein
MDPIGRWTSQHIAIVVAAVIIVVVGVVGGIGIAASGGSSSGSSSNNSSSNNSAASAPAQSPSQVCYSVLEGWATYEISTNDSSTIFPEFGTNSGIPTDVAEAVGGAVAAADQNGIQAGRDSLSSAITTDCTTLIGAGDNPSSWPTAPSS